MGYWAGLFLLLLVELAERLEVELEKGVIHIISLL